MQQFSDRQDVYVHASEELSATTTRRDVQPLIDKMFDASKLHYTLGFTELGFLKQADWIGAVLPGGPEGWSLTGPVPEQAHLLHIDYGAPFFQTIRARKPPWIYTVLPGAWGIDLSLTEGDIQTGDANVADRAWRWPPYRQVMLTQFSCSATGANLDVYSPFVMFDRTAEWLCVQDTEADCYMAGSPRFMADFFARCPGGETGIRWRGVEALHLLDPKLNLSAEKNRPGFEAFHIRRIEPRPGACPRECMATLWPYEPATIPLGSPWDGPTPDDLSEDDARMVAERWTTAAGPPGRSEPR